jgi:hypothetical protein
MRPSWSCAYIYWTFYFNLFICNGIVCRGTEWKLWFCLRSNFCFMRGGRQSIYFATNVFRIDMSCTCWQRGQFQYIADIMLYVLNDVCTVFFAAERLRPGQVYVKPCVQNTRARARTHTHTQLLVSFRNGYPMENPVSYLLCGKLLQKNC